MLKDCSSWMLRLCCCVLVLHVQSAASVLPVVLNGIVTSPSYPQMYDREAWAAQRVPSDDGYNGADYLIFWVDDLDLPPPVTQPSTPGGSCTEYVRIYEVDSQRVEHDIAILCGSIDRYDMSSRYVITVHGNVAYVDMVFDLGRPETVGHTGRGFRLMYTGGYLSCPEPEYYLDLSVLPSGPMSLLASQQFPDNKCPPTETSVYNVLDSPYVTFTIVYFDSSKTCSSSKLDVSKKTGPQSFLTAGLCGGNISEFVQTAFTMPLVNDQRLFAMGVGINFLVQYNYIDHPGSALYASHWPRVELDYDTIEEGATCEWSLQSPAGTSLYITASTIQLFKPSLHYCRYHGLYVTSEQQLLFYHCPDTNLLQNNSTIIATSNLMHIRLNNVSRDAGVYFNFSVGYYSKNSASVSPTVTSICGDDEPLSRTPVVSRIMPELGIMAGGTRLTLSGNNFPPHHVLMAYAGYQAASLEPCSDTTCYAMTPPGREKDIGISLPVSVTFPGRRPISTQFTFTYRSNPKVSSIHPLETLAAGGTTLTVDGEGFDAVNEPELIVRMVHTKESSGNSTVNETTTTSQCAIAANDTLKCPTPALDIPEEFKKAIGTQSADAGGSNGENDAAGDYVWDIAGQSLEFHLGVRLDGEQKYRDLTKSLPEYSRIKVFLQEPEFDRFTETREVSGGESLEITGKRLTDGLEKTDYVVRIGVGSCHVVDITANQLLCEIPEEEVLAEEDEHSVLVYPGTNISPHNIGMIQYKSRQTTLWIIIGACVGIVLIAIICCMIGCLIRRASNKRKQQEEQQQQAVQMQEQKQRHEPHQVQPQQGKQNKRSQPPNEPGYLNDNMAPGLRQPDHRNHANDHSDEGYLNDHFAP